jgi:hypothetical protein
MKLSWLCASAAVVALGVGLSAQAPGQGQPATQAPTTQAPPATQRPETQRPSTPSTASGEPRMMTLIGCLQPAGAPSSATPGAVGTAGSPSASQFILTNARAGMGSGSGTTYSTSPGNAPAAGGATAPGVPATPGASASDRPAASSMSYALEGQASQLKDHVGHQVEVTGRLNQSSSSSSSANPNADRDSTSRDSSRSATSTPMSRFDVQSVKMIAATCSR